MKSVPRLAASEEKPPATKLCLGCRKPFEPTTPRQDRCDPKSYGEAYREAHRESTIKDKAKYSAVKKKLAQSKTASAARLKLRALRQIARRKAFVAKWSKLDWSKQDYELADEMNLSRERIRQIREELGAPKATRHRWRRKTAQAFLWANDKLDQLKGMSATEVERKYKLSRHWRQGPKHRFLEPFLRDGRINRKHPWNLMNFSLPSQDLERIWRLPRNVASNNRRLKQIRPPRWSFQGGNQQFCGRTRFQAYHRAVKAEERKAARHFDTA